MLSKIMLNRRRNKKKGRAWITCWEGVYTWVLFGPRQQTMINNR